MDQRSLTFGMSFDGIGSAINQLREANDTILGIRNSFQESQNQTQNWGAQTQASAAAVAESLEGIRGAADGVGGSLGDTGASGSQALSEMGSAAHRARDALGDTEDAAGRMGSSLDAVAGQAGNLGNTTESSIGQMGGAFRDAARQVGNLGDEAESSLGGLGGSLEDVAGRTGDLGDEAESSMNRMGGAIRNAEADAEGLGSSVSGAARSGLRDHDNMTNGIRRGMNDAAGNSEKRMGIFGKFMKKTAEAGTKAFKGPTTFIKDKFYGAVERVCNRLNGLENDSDSAGDSLQDTGEKGASAGNSIADAISGAAKAFVIFKVGTELVKASFSALKEFASSLLEVGINAEQVGAKFDVAFEGTAVADWAANFSSAIHRSEDEVKSFLTSNKKMYTELGITGTAADDLSKISTSLAYDLGSAFSLEDAEALSVMQDYIGGNTKALGEYGIRIDDAILKQTALDMGLGSNVGALNEAAQAQVRMTALLENGTKIQEAAAKKQDGYANSVKGIKGVWTDFMGDAAQKFAPVFSDLVSVIIDSWPTIEPVLMGMMTALSDGMADAIPFISDLATNFLPQLMDAFTGVGSALAPIGGVILDLAMTALPPLIEAVGPIISVISELAQAILPPFAEIITNIATTVVPPLVAVLKSLSDNVIQPLIPPLSTIINALLPALSAALGIIPPALEIISPILEGIGGILSTIIGFLSKIVEWAAGGLGTLLEKIGGLFGGGGSAKGASIPHNARGTDDFPGGLTHINEEGGEIVGLPSGSTILPADRSRELIQSIANNQNSGTVQSTFSPNIVINVSGGGMDEAAMADLERRMMEKIRELYAEFNDDNYTNLAIQMGNT